MTCGEVWGKGMQVHDEVVGELEEPGINSMYEMEAKDCICQRVQAIVKLRKLDFLVT